MTKRTIQTAARAAQPRLEALRMGKGEIRRLRTIQSDLAFLMVLLPQLGGTTPARLELSVGEDGRVIAQLVGDRLAMPLVGIGLSSTLAIRQLVDEIRKLAEVG